MNRLEIQLALQFRYTDLNIAMANHYSKIGSNELAERYLDIAQGYIINCDKLHDEIIKSHKNELYPPCELNLISENDNIVERLTSEDFIYMAMEPHCLASFLDLLRSETLLEIPLCYSSPDDRIVTEIVEIGFECEGYLEWADMPDFFEAPGQDGVEVTEREFIDAVKKFVGSK